MIRYHSFDAAMIAQAVEAARAHSEICLAGAADDMPAAPLLVKGDCTELEVTDGTVGFELPFGLGRLTLALPGPHAALARIRVNLDIYALAGEPTGAKITLSAGEEVILRRTVAGR